MSETIIEKYADADALVAAAGDRLALAIAGALAERGKAMIVLTGGGTGIALLKHLRDVASDLDWDNVHVFWGDDRYVPKTDPERNAWQAWEALLEYVNLPLRNMHAMPNSESEYGTDLDAAALAYEQLLAANAEPGQDCPAFDVHLLGMGGEGHVNSLFPHTDAVKETQRLVVAVPDSPKPPPQRITLTLPAIQCSREVWLVVSGEAKAEAVAAAIGGADPIDVPAAGARGIERTVWLLDDAAASQLG